MAQERVVEVGLISASNLKDVNFLSKMEAYAVLSLPPYVEYTTQVDAKGGVNPRWEETLGFLLPDSLLRKEDAPPIKVQIFTLSTFGPRFVSEASIPLSDLSPLDGLTHPTYKRYSLKTSSGDYHGHLHVSLALGDFVVLKKGETPSYPIVTSPRGRPPSLGQHGPLETLHPTTYESVKPSPLKPIDPYDPILAPFHKSPQAPPHSTYDSVRSVPQPTTYVPQPTTYASQPTKYNNFTTTLPSTPFKPLPPQSTTYDTMKPVSFNIGGLPSTQLKPLAQPTTPLVYARQPIRDSTSTSIDKVIPNNTPTNLTNVPITKIGGQPTIRDSNLGKVAPNTIPTNLMNVPITKIGGQPTRDSTSTNLGKVSPNTTTTNITNVPISRIGGQSHYPQISFDQGGLGHEASQDYKVSPTSHNPLFASPIGKLLLTDQRKSIPYDQRY